MEVGQMINSSDSPRINWPIDRICVSGVAKGCATSHLAQAFRVMYLRIPIIYVLSKFSVTMEVVISLSSVIFSLVKAY